MSPMLFGKFDPLRQARAEAKQNYDKRGKGPTRKHWTEAELARIANIERPPDTVLSEELGCSVAAIRVMRSKFNKLRETRT